MDLANAAAALKAKNVTDTPTVMIIHFGRANNIYFVMSGRGGVGDKMIALAGGKTVTYDAKGARQISAEAVAVSKPRYYYCYRLWVRPNGEYGKNL